MILGIRTKKKIPLRDYFPEYESGAIFSSMPDAPWVSDNIGLQLDIAYFASWSGDKPATKFVDRMSTNGVADTEKVATILWKLYGDAWTKLYNAFKLDYTPTDNYNISETIDSNKTDNKITNDNGSINTTTSSTDSSTTTTEETTTVQYGKVDTVNGESDTYTYGFNSENQVPTTAVIDKNTDTQSGQDTTTRNGTSTTNGTSSGTTGTVTGNKEIVDGTETENITRNRTGNIGQTSYQDLIRQELELRKWSFFRQLFEDCDRFLVLSIYDPCTLE